MPGCEQETRRRDWDASAAGWEAWFDTVESAAAPVSERLLELARLEPGDRVLDVATGTGEPALAAARRISPDGRVFATDISPGMIAAARRRAARLGMENVRFEALAAEDLGRLGQCFDAVLCRWGLMFVPEVEASLGVLRRLLRPGGRLAAAAWAEPAEVPMLGLERSALAPWFEPGHFDTGFDRANAFRLAEPGLLETLLARAGFGDVNCGRVMVVYEFDSPGEYVRFRQAVSSNAAALAQRHPAAEVAAAWEAVAAAVAERADTDGHIRLENAALCVAGSA